MLLVGFGKLFVLILKRQSALTQRILSMVFYRSKFLRFTINKFKIRALDHLKLTFDYQNSNFINTQIYILNNSDL